MMIQYQTHQISVQGSKAELLKVLSHCSWNEDQLDLKKANNIAQLFGLELEKSGPLLAGDIHFRQTEVERLKKNIDPKPIDKPHPSLLEQRPAHSFYYLMDQEPRSTQALLTPEVSGTPWSEEIFKKDAPSPSLSFKPLVPWSQIWPRIYQSLNHEFLSRTLNIKPILKSFLQGKVLKKIPHQPRHNWHSQGQIWLDMDPRLTPIRGDWHWLADQIIHWRGEEGLSVYCLRDGILGNQVYERPRPGQEFPAPAQPIRNRLPTEPLPVLIVSDLGMTDPQKNNVKESWVRLGQAFQCRGIRPTVLLLYDLRLPTELAPYYQVIAWEQKSHFINMDYERAISLCAYLLRVEFHLFRAICRLLGLGVKAELAAWQDSRILGESRYWYFDPAIEKNRAITQLRQTAAQDPLENTAWQLISRVHQATPLEIQLEEYQHRKLHTHHQDPHFENYWSGLLATLSQPDSKKTRFNHQVQLWTQRLCDRYSDDQKFSAEYVQLSKLSHEDTLDPDIPVQHLQMHQVGQELIETEATQEAFTSHKPLVNLTIQTEITYYEIYEADQCIQVNALKPTEPLYCKPEQKLVIYDRDKIHTLGRMKRPNWSQNLFQDQTGLGVHFFDGQNQTQQAYWLPAGQYPVKTDKQDKILTIKQGFFWREAEYLAWQNYQAFTQPAWAVDFGIDEFGLYADWEYESIRQRMRWIQPGEFLMGSPEEEVGRTDNETQHLVTLTQAYWLADTACTQALWQAVIGENPSNFQEHESLPVENVRWHDAKKFIDRLSSIQPELLLRLPTEAEWEYACRAGTTTPFSFGETITTGVKRGKTLPVKSLPANPWGLYEMHGNVWEWCEDRGAEYDMQALVDPKGPEDSAFRVFRGGGWSSRAQLLRSAVRCWNHPDFRNGSLGFRLACGQDTLQSSKPEEPVRKFR